MEPAHAMVMDPPDRRTEQRATSGRWSIEAWSGWESTQPSRQAGDVLMERYELLAPLGEGGMGAVWRAHCAALDIDVAVKVLHRNNGDENAAARLLREARATASLRHPAVVRTLDFGTTEEGEPFLVMELLEGTSLSSWIAEHGRMSAVQAVKALLPIADGLAAAHARGIVHRDVKPGNIMVKLEGTEPTNPKIFDFGIAKVVASDVGTLTQEGAVLGSMQYMSPEQATGQIVGPQTDVWAFSVLLYELITGKRPFDAPSMVAMIYAVFHCIPAPTTDFAAGDQALWNIIEKGLRKSPNDRWPSMQAFGRALAAWAIDQGETVDASATSIAHHWLSGEHAPISSERSVSKVTISPEASSVSLPRPVQNSLADTGIAFPIVELAGEGAPAPSNEARLAVEAPVEPLPVRAVVEAPQSVSSGEEILSPDDTLSGAKIAGSVQAASRRRRARVASVFAVVSACALVALASFTHHAETARASQTSQTNASALHVAPAEIPAQVASPGPVAVAPTPERPATAPSAVAVEPPAARPSTVASTSSVSSAHLGPRRPVTRASVQMPLPAAPSF